MFGLFARPGPRQIIGSNNLHMVGGQKNVSHPSRCSSEEVDDAKENAMRQRLIDEVLAVFDKTNRELKERVEFLEELVETLTAEKDEGAEELARQVSSYEEELLVLFSQRSALEDTLARESARRVSETVQRKRLEKELLEQKALVDYLQVQVEKLRIGIFSNEEEHCLRNSMMEIPSKTLGGTEWQVRESVASKWIPLPTERSQELQRRFEAHLRGEAGVVQLKYLEAECEFDFKTMSQRNLRTNTCSKLRCMFATPPHWTRCLDMASVYQLRAHRTMQISGCEKSMLNGVYVESTFDKLCGHFVWWKTSGDVMIFSDGAGKWCWLKPSSSHYENLRKGGVVACTARAFGNEPFGEGKCYLFHDGSWTEADVRRTLVKPIPGLSFVNTTVEVFDDDTRQRLTDFLRGSVVHADTAHDGASACNCLKEQVRVVRMLRIENWPLWKRYVTGLACATQERTQNRIEVSLIDPPLPDVFNVFSEDYCGGVDYCVNECFLFHGTKFDHAVQIALEGFDIGVSNPNCYYGQGIYFTSQACKSHRYTKKSRGLHTIIISRVALGDICYAQKVDQDCRQPPLRGGTGRPYDSIVARPGPMPGHHEGVQTHQEFVIFNRCQAYPEVIAQYALE